MKKAYLILTSMIVFSLGANSQSLKMVMYEHFTQASCGPCASLNPGMQAIVDDAQNAGRLTSVKYQTSWPGYDPMHDHNPNEVNSRVSYYGINSVPTGVLDGNAWSGNTGGFSQSLVDVEKAKTSPFEIDLSHGFNANMDEIEVEMKIKATGNLNVSNLKAHIVVIEKEITFATPPGSNGEKVFWNVMKKMLPNASGNTLPSTINVGDSISITKSWKMANIYDYDEIAVVAFIQNNGTSEIYQAAISEPIPYVANYNLNVQSIELAQIPVETCESEISPEFTFRNGGGTTITSANFEYSINGSTPQTYSFSGLLPFGDEKVVQLGTIPFTLQDVNEMIIYPVSVNGSTDQYTVGDTMRVEFNKTTDYNPYLQVDILAYNGADETVWRIWDSQGNVVASNGTYENGVAATEYVSIQNEDCYRFEMYQNNTSTSFNGTFVVTDLNGQTLISSVYGSNDIDKNFTIDASSLSVDELNSEKVISVFPNPSNGIINIGSSINGRAILTDITGRVIENIKLVKGTRTTINELKTGVYFIKVNGDYNTIEKIIVQ